MDKNLFSAVYADKTYLMLKNRNIINLDADFKIVHTIQSNKIRYLSEIPTGSDERVFALYSNTPDEQVLEIFDLDLKLKRVSNIEKRYINGSIEVINPTTFFYKDTTNIKTILSVYGNQLQPQKSKIDNIQTSNILKVSDVTLGDCYIKEGIYEIVLHIGNVEKLHLLLVPPTRKYQYFMVYRQVYSELTDKYFDILTGINDKDEYLSYESFIRLFSSSDLAMEIFEKGQQYQTNVNNQVLALKKQIME